MSDINQSTFFDLGNISSIVEQIKDTSIRAKPFLASSFLKYKDSTSYNKLIHSLNYLVETCERTLSTHNDIVVARYAMLMTLLPHRDLSNKIIIQKLNNEQDIASLLVQLLYTCSQLWFLSIECCPRDHRKEEYTPQHHGMTSDTVESKLLLSLLRFINRIAQVDCVLGEELARAGSHSILSQVIQYDYMTAASALNEIDEDMIFEIQDWACSIGQIPIFLNPLTFPVKISPYSHLELISRLPVPFLLRQSSTSSLIRLGHDLFNHHTDIKMSPCQVIWIQHITERQLEQYDVGFGTFNIIFRSYVMHIDKSDMKS